MNIEQIAIRFTDRPYPTPGTSPRHAPSPQPSESANAPANTPHSYGHSTGSPGTGQTTCIKRTLSSWPRCTTKQAELPRGRHLTVPPPCRVLNTPRCG
jgi:hypothetical protein